MKKKQFFDTINTIRKNEAKKLSENKSITFRKKNVKSEKGFNHEVISSLLMFGTLRRTTTLTLFSLMMTFLTDLTVLMP